jgi:RNA polymerase sigma-70 factor (ECF subfamily)
MNTEPTRLLNQAREGDMDAFAQLFEPLRRRVYGVARTLVGVEDAEDVVMDTFLKAWRGLPRLRQVGAIRGWLYRIARNCAMDRIRLRQHRGETSLSSNPEETAAMQDVPDTSQPLPADKIAAAESAETIRAAVGQLPEAHRQVVELRYTDDLSYSEISAALGISIGTVMSRLFNAKRKLRALLGEYK